MTLKANLFLTFTLVIPSLGYGSLFNMQSETQILLSKTELFDFGEVYTDMFSDVQFYEVSAENLTSDLLISVDNSFRISLHCYDHFGQSITLKPASGMIPNTRIFVRFYPEQTGQQQTTINHSTESAVIKTVAVSGRGSDKQIPSDYYSTATGEGEQLKTQLHQIINQHNTQTYSSLWTHFKSTDATFSGKVWDIYSDIPCDDPPYIYTFEVDQDRGSGGGEEGEYYNREHSFPRAWFGGTRDPMNTDLFHIYPTDKRVNSIRDKLPFGEVNNPSTTTSNGSKKGTNVIPGYSGTAFEPIDPYKGDLARTYFYMITRYENLIENWTYSAEGMAMLDNNTFPGYKQWAIEMLIDWHELDAVSQKEIQRNNAIFQIQGNRNPYIDHPEFVRQIWDSSSTSITEQKSNNTFRLYPNPANDYFKIDGPAETFDVRIFSSYGELILIRNNVNSGCRLDTNGLKAGPYIVQILTDSKPIHLILVIF